jgi:hypothetical protein
MEYHRSMNETNHWRKIYSRVSRVLREIQAYFRAGRFTASSRGATIAGRVARVHRALRLILNIWRELSLQLGKFEGFL